MLTNHTIHTSNAFQVASSCDNPWPREARSGRGPRTPTAASRPPLSRLPLPPRPPTPCPPHLTSRSVNKSIKRERESPSTNINTRGRRTRRRTRKRKTRKRAKGRIGKQGLNLESPPSPFLFLLPLLPLLQAYHPVLHHLLLQSGQPWHPCPSRPTEPNKP